MNRELTCQLISFLPSDIMHRIKTEVKWQAEGRMGMREGGSTREREEG